MGNFDHNGVFKRATRMVFVRGSGEGSRVLIKLSIAKGLLLRAYWRLTDFLGPDRARQRAHDRVHDVEEKLKRKLKLHPNKRLRVGFLVVDQAKWSGQPLLERLSQDPDIECGFYLGLSDVALRMNRCERRAQYGKVKDFFAGRGVIWNELYRPDIDCARSLKLIDCDVLFLQQPWGMQELTRRISHRVLCAFFSYGFVLYSNDKGHFGLPNFHRYLWRYFSQNEFETALIKSSNLPGRPIESAIATTGYPKMDVYLKPSAPLSDCDAKTSPRPRVIYAPHHAKGQHTLNVATYDWSMQAVETLSIEHSEIDFVLKPHPNFAHSIGVQSAEERKDSAQWFERWRSRSNCSIYEAGDYFRLFNNSDLLITDSVSFLAEYLPTTNPIIRLINPHNRIAHTPLGEALSHAFYDVDSSHSLHALFDRLIIEKVDALHPVRMEKSRLVFDPVSCASDAIAKEIKTLL